MTARPDIHTYFMFIAEVVATRSTCLRRQVGAVLVKNKHIISTGYNGSPQGLAHCLDIGCLRDQENIPSGTMHEVCRAVHAEQNAVIQAALHGINIHGATLYCTLHPCVLCTKILINAEIDCVIYKDDYPDKIALEFFKIAGIKTEKFNV